MSANEVHNGDIGTIFRVTVQDSTTAVDISGASTKNIVLQKPSGTKVTAAGSFQTDGTDGVLQYTSTGGVIDTVGNWRIQVYLVLAAGTWYTDVGNFYVHPNIPIR